jgi:hypothetical protein
MKKSAINSMPEFFDRYINLVEDIDIHEALKKYSFKLTGEDVELLKLLGDKKYAPEKWTVKDILQHMIDTERIQAYRALRFARNDQSVLPGFDEQLYGAQANASRRSVADLLDEYIYVRKSSILLFESFDNSMLVRSGVCNKINISVLALGFVIVGHGIHHINVIKEKYYPLK